MDEGVEGSRWEELFKNASAVSSDDQVLSTAAADTKAASDTTAVVDMHEPDKWGIIQFSGPDGVGGDFEPMGSWGVRETLMNVYYAQKSYRVAWGSYSEDAGDLDEYAPVEGSCLECGDVEIEVEGEDWTAVATVGGWKGRINQVRYLTVEKVETF